MSDAHENPPDEEIRRVLGRSMTIAVVGLSPDPMRESHRVAAFLQRLGHRIIPVHPEPGTILGERVYASLRDVPVPIDMVDVFRRSDAVAAIVDDVLVVGAPLLWLQLGVIDAAAAARARAAGVTVVMDRCPAIEYRRLFPAEG